MRPHEIQEKLGLTRIRDRNWYVQPACATTGDGLYEGLTWLTSNHKSWTGSYWWCTSFFPFLFGKKPSFFCYYYFFFFEKKKRSYYTKFLSHFKIRNLNHQQTAPSIQPEWEKKTEHSFFKNWKVLKEKNPE